MSGRYQHYPSLVQMIPSHDFTAGQELFLQFFNQMGVFSLRDSLKMLLEIAMITSQGRPIAKKGAYENINQSSVCVLSSTNCQQIVNKPKCRVLT